MRFAVVNEFNGVNPVQRGRRITRRVRIRKEAVIRKDSMEDENTLAWKVDAAFRQAAFKVIQRAKNAGSLVVIWEDDQIKEVPPEELESRITAQLPPEPRA